MRRGSTKVRSVGRLGLVQGDLVTLVKTQKRPVAAMGTRIRRKNQS